MCDLERNLLGNDFQIWFDRWLSLKQAIDDTIQSFKRDPLKKARDEGERWIVILEMSLERLLVFAEDQFCFLLKGFKDETLAESPDFRKEYAFRRTLDQIAYDLTVMQQIRDQRFFGSKEEIKTLDKADKLAYKALEPAIQNNLLAKTTTTLTYLQKSTKVRVIPYAPVAFIGVPRTAVGYESGEGDETERDLLAIAHEVGHYVFWHGKTTNAKGKEVSLQALLRVGLPDDPSWRLNWLEEIFADVYGTIVAGPVLAKGFQEILFDSLNLLEDDHVHPIPVIRPFIYLATLEFLLVDFTTSRKKLKDLREESLKDRAYISEIRGIDVFDVEWEKEENYLRETVKYILTILTSSSGGLQPLNNSSQIWSKNSDDFEELFVKFSQFLNGLNEFPPATNTANLEGMPDPANPTQQIKWEPFKSLEFLKIAQEIGLKLPPGLWTRLLDAGGWSTAGPEDDGVPK